jgi:uncharacterized protein (DUF1810 family)
LTQPDPFRLERFVRAQADVYGDVIVELHNGEKQSHWMWFIFPQIRGLGSSPTAREFAISSVDEARAYLAHPLLGARLQQCTTLVNAIRGRTLEEIFHSPDSTKFRSSMTLFARATADNGMFLDALKKYCNGESDPRTLQILGVSE